MEYVVGITEQELELVYNKTNDLSNWSELTKTEKLEVIWDYNLSLRRTYRRESKFDKFINS